MHGRVEKVRSEQCRVKNTEHLDCAAGESRRVIVKQEQEESDQQSLPSTISTLAYPLILILSLSQCLASASEALGEGSGIGALLLGSSPKQCYR